MPFYLLTFRPQPSEYDLLDTYWTILKPALDDNKNILNYIITVEKDATIDRHCHCLVEFAKTKSKKNQLQSFFNTQKFRDFNQMLRNVMTNLKWAKDDRKVSDTEEDLLYTIGYVLKETQASRRFYTLTEDRCIEGINYYYQNQKIDKSQPEKCNLRIMTSKNIHVNILDYCRSKDIKEIRYPAYLRTKMKKDGYMFSQVSKVQETMDELDIFMNPDKYEDETDTDNPTSYHDLMEHNRMQALRIKTLEKQLKQIRYATQDHVELKYIHTMTNQVNYFSSDDEE